MALEPQPFLELDQGVAIDIDADDLVALVKVLGEIAGAAADFEDLVALADQFDVEILPRFVSLQVVVFSMGLKFLIEFGDLGLCLVFTHAWQRERR